MTVIKFKSDLPPLSLVTFDHEANHILGVVKEFSKGKYTVITETKQKLALSGHRLNLIKMPITVSKDDTVEAIATMLSGLREKVLKLVTQDVLEEIWEFSSDEPVELSLEDLCLTYFGNRSPDAMLGLRLRMINEGIHFRRGKSGFIPRSAIAIKEMQAEEVSEAKAQARMQRVIDTFVEALQKINQPDYKKGYTKLLNATESLELKDELELLTVFAACGEHLDGPKEKAVKQLIADIKAELGGIWNKIKSSNNTLQNEEAYDLLLALGEFTHHQNLALIRYKPLRSWSKEALDELVSLKEQSLNGVARIDLTHLPSFTIDDPNTQDIDDALSIIQLTNGYQLGIHISDVAQFIPTNTPTLPIDSFENITSHLDVEAAQRGSSIYCPDIVINMLPTELSEELLSLHPNRQRPCVSLILELDPQLNIIDHKFCRTLISSHRRYGYDEVDELLDEENPPFELATLSQFAASMEGKRVSEGGASDFNRKELNFEPSRNPDEPPIVKTIDVNTPARSLVAEMMVLYNHYAACFAVRHQLAFPFRIQGRPEEPDENIKVIPFGPARDYALRGLIKRSELVFSPEVSSKGGLGHHSLGLSCYTQVTSPIRRYFDLCGQRQIVSILEDNRPIYTVEDFNKINLVVGESLNKVQLISRESKRYWLLEYLRFIMLKKQLLSGVVIRSDHRGILVEIEEFGFNHLVRSNNTPPPLNSTIKLEITSINPRNDILKMKIAKD
jgi:exoribonuclease-2